MYGLERLTYLCLKGDTHTDFYTAFATEELRATPPTVLCSVSLSITVYTKTRNPAALVFIPICAGRRAGMRIFMNEKWIVFEQREGTGNQVRFGDRMVDADGLSEETLEWLDWYLKILYNRN